MATQSPFDPDKVDPEFYAHDPHREGTSDYGHESEGVGTAQFNSRSGLDADTEIRDDVAATRAANWGQNRPDTPGGESVGTHQEWDVNPELLNPDKPQRGMTDAEASKLEQIADNPSDEALFHRGDATYLEQRDDPNQHYDPHNKGYDGKAGK